MIEIILKMESIFTWFFTQKYTSTLQTTSIWIQDKAKLSNKFPFVVVGNASSIYTSNTSSGFFVGIIFDFSTGLGKYCRECLYCGEMLAVESYLPCKDGLQT